MTFRPVLLHFGLAALLALGLTGSARAASPHHRPKTRGAAQVAAQPAEKAAAARGLRLAQEKCGRCHLVDNAAEGAKGSPNPSAPPFQVIALTYEPSDLEEALTEGIMVGHNDAGDPQMPEFEFDPDQAGDLVAYLQSLRKH